MHELYKKNGQNDHYHAATYEGCSTYQNRLATLKKQCQWTKKIDIPWIKTNLCVNWTIFKRLTECQKGIIQPFQWIKSRTKIAKLTCHTRKSTGRIKKPWAKWTKHKKLSEYQKRTILPIQWMKSTAKTTKRTCNLRTLTVVSCHAHHLNQKNYQISITKPSTTISIESNIDYLFEWVSPEILLGKIYSYTYPNRMPTMT